MKIGVLADDLTGAGDVALAFESFGRSAEILMGDGASPSAGVDVWIIDTESRNLSPRVAARRVRRAVARLKHWKAAFIFKKIDSTLRGPLAAETAAFLDALKTPGPVAFSPAFPAAGRTVKNGRLFIGGVPLPRTPFGRDPRHPRRTDQVAVLLGPAASRVRTPDVLRDADHARLARAVVSGAGFFPGAAVGSAGFAAALARALRPGRRPARLKNSLPRPVDRRVLLVSGSAHPVSRRQAQALRKSADVRIVSSPRRRGRPGEVLGSLVKAALLHEKETGVRLFAAAGGETAAALARAWGLRRWRVAARVDRGVPLCVSPDDPGRRMVLKPGGFGGPALWRRALRFLRR